MRSWSYIPMDAHRKKLVALRMYYLGGYTHYFSDLLAKLLSDGYTGEEIIAACVDPGMERMVNDFVNRGKQDDQDA